MSQPYWSPPARFLSGVSTQPRKSLLGDFSLPNPLCANVYVNDFNSYVAGDWTVTTVNSGTTALLSANGGWLRFTGGGTATNFQGITLNPASFAISPGFAAWFACRFTVSDIASAASPSFIIGMVKGTVAAPTDGIYFTKASGANQKVSAVIRTASTSTTITNVATLADATAVTLGWYYDGFATPTVYFYSSSVADTTTAFSFPPMIGGQIVSSASSDPAAAVSLANIPTITTIMAPQVYMVQPTTVASPTIDVDYILAAAELNRY
jgi:hypothetical protein